MSRYLDMGMVPAGEGHAAGDDPSPTSVVGTEAAASTSGEVVSITPTTSAHERCGRTRETSSHDRSSDFALNSDGEQVSVHAVEEETETPRGPPPPQPVGSVASALAGGLHGVWMEPLDDAPPVDPEASSSSSSASSDHVASHATTTLTTGLGVDLGDLLYLFYHYALGERDWARDSAYFCAGAVAYEYVVFLDFIYHDFATDRVYNKDGSGWTRT